MRKLFVALIAMVVLIGFVFAAAYADVVAPDNKVVVGYTSDNSTVAISGLTLSSSGTATTASASEATYAYGTLPLTQPVCKESHTAYFMKTTGAIHHAVAIVDAATAKTRPIVLLTRTPDHVLRV